MNGMQAVFNSWIVFSYLLTRLETGTVYANVLTDEGYRVEPSSESHENEKKGQASCSLSLTKYSAFIGTESGRETYRYGDGCHFCGCSNKLLDVVAIVALALTLFYFLLITKVITVGRKRRSPSSNCQSNGFFELSSGTVTRFVSIPLVYFPAVKKRN